MSALTTPTLRPTSIRLRRVVGATLLLAGVGGVIEQPVQLLTNVPLSDLGSVLVDGQMVASNVIPVVLLVLGLALVIPGSLPRPRERLLVLAAAVAAGTWFVVFAQGALSAATFTLYLEGALEWNVVSPVAVVGLALLPVLIGGPYLWLRAKGGALGAVRARAYAIDCVIVAGALAAVSAALLSWTVLRPLVVNVLFSGDATWGSTFQLKFLLAMWSCAALLGVGLGAVAWRLAGRRYRGDRVHVLVFLGGVSAIAQVIPTLWSSVAALQAYARIDAAAWRDQFEPVLEDETFEPLDSSETLTEDWYVEGDVSDPGGSSAMSDEDPFAELDAAGPDATVVSDPPIGGEVQDLYTVPGPLFDAALGWQEYLVVTLDALPILIIAVASIIVACRALGRLVPTLR